MYKILITGILVLCSCTDQKPQSFQVVNSTDQILNEKLKASLSHLTQACPGLDKYSNDLTPATISKSRMRGYEDGIELTFKVISNPQALPVPLNRRSAQNTCYISINKDGTSAYIGKTACHSICEGRLQENDADIMGREFALNPVSMNR